MRSLTWICLAAALCSSAAHAGGVGLGATRMVYSGATTQSMLQIRNTHPDSSFLIQSWIENEQGSRSNDFIITPPLYVLKPASESAVKMMFNGKSLPQDRETLFWMNVKAIPSMDKSKLSDNTLQLAIISRIKLYYRPGKLALPPDQAAEKLTFSRSGSSLTLTNPTPYYLTVTELNAGTRILENALVPPMGKTSVKLPADAGNTITYRTINDYGALTPKMNGVLR